MERSGRIYRLAQTGVVLAAGALTIGGGAAVAQAGGASSGAPNAASNAAVEFGAANPFYAASTLPFQAPPFDRIHDSDYEPAIEAGMMQLRAETEAIANNPEAATFENTIVAMERSGQLLTRVTLVFGGVAQANTNPTLEKVQEIEAPKLAATQDAVYLDSKLFARVAKLYDERATLKLDAESLRLLEYDHQQFVKAGAKLSDADKTKLKKLNEEEATLSAAFTTKLLAATKAAAYSTADKVALGGLSDAQIAGAGLAAKERNAQGYTIPLQNTTQQPDLAELTDRETRQALFEDSWTRAERDGPHDTRATIARLAQVRAEKAQLLGFPNYAAWTLQDQMAKTPEAALKFMDALVPASTAKARSEGADIQQLIDSQHGGFQLQPWDWDFYSEQVPSMISTRRRSSLTSSLIACWRTASFTRRIRSMALRSRSAGTFRCISRMCASSRSMM
jgi:peptidyl-dipeptidase Dcp